MSRSIITRRLATAVSQNAQLQPQQQPSIVHLPLTYWPQPSASASSSTASTSQLPPTSNTQTAALTPSYVTLPSYIFSAPPRPDILHQCVVTHLASLRQGTHATKNRSQVKGSSRKIMRQKGSGKARVGDAQSPIRRGGGHAFAKRPKDWSIGLNRKVWELGVRTALSERWRRGELTVIPESPEMPSISTRKLVSAIRQQPFSATWEDSLFLLSSISPSFELSARNLSGIDVRLVDELDVYSLLQGKRVILDMKAVQILEDWLGEEARDARRTHIAKALPSSPYLDVQEFSKMSLGATPPPQPTANEETDNDGGIKQNDVVIDQEEAPVQEQRHDVDPLGSDKPSGEEKGDAIRQEMEDLSKQQGDKTEAVDSPSTKDVL